MSGAENIRIIAKTALLEEKIAKAQAAADAANTATNPTHPSERGVTVENGTDSQTFGSANGPPPDGMVAQKLYAGYDPSGGVGTIDQAMWMITQAAASPLNPNLLNAGSDKLTNSQSNSSVATGGAGSGGGGGGLSTDMTGAASSGATNTGGSNTTALAQGAPGDTTLSGMVTAATALGASASDIANMKADYLANKYGEDGIVTAKQIGDNNSNNPSRNIYQNGSNSFSDTASPALPERLKGIVGFDQNGTVSPVTGKVLTQLVRIGAPTPTYTIPTDADANHGGQPSWNNSPNPPTKPNFQLGKYWSVTNPEGAVGSTPNECMDNGIASLHIINPGGGYGAAWWDPSTLAASGVNFTATWYVGPGVTAPNVVTITRGNCPMPGSFSAYYGYNPTANCPSVAPVYTYWPKTGSFVLNWIGAQIYSSVYDSEVPIRYQAATSTVRVAMGDGSTVVDGRFLDIQPGIQGGYVLSTIASDGVTINSANYYDANGVLSQPNLTSADVPYYLPPR